MSDTAPRNGDPTAYLRDRIERLERQHNESSAVLLAQLRDMQEQLGIAVKSFGDDHTSLMEAIMRLDRKVTRRLRPPQKRRK